MSRRRFALRVAVTPPPPEKPPKVLRETPEAGMPRTGRNFAEPPERHQTIVSFPYVKDSRLQPFEPSFRGKRAAEGRTDPFRAIPMPIIVSPR